MSRNSSEKRESYLEESKAFTLKGEEENIFEESAKIEIETNKKAPEPIDNANDIIITNLTNYSFGIPEHQYSNENDEFNESGKDLIENFKKSKRSITPKMRKCDSVVKIKLTKNNRDKIFKLSKEDVINMKIINKNVNISDKEIDSLLEMTNLNNENIDEPSEDNKMELENEEKKEEKIYHVEESIQDDNVNISSENAEYDKKVKEDYDMNIMREVNSINVKESSSDMIIEPDNSDEHDKEKEKEKEKENELNMNGGIGDSMLNDISTLTLENGLNKIIKEKIEEKDNIIMNKEIREEKKEEENIIEENPEEIIKENEDKKIPQEAKEEKKKINSKQIKEKENKIMANEDINMNAKSKVKENEKIRENINENDKEKNPEEIQTQIKKVCAEEEIDKKIADANYVQNISNINETKAKEVEDNKEEDEDLIIDERRDNEENKENIVNKEEINNIDNKRIENIEENVNKIEEEKENEIEEKNKKDNKGQEESNKINNALNNSQNLNDIQNSDLFKKMLTEQIYDLFKDLIQNKTNNLQNIFNPRENEQLQEKYKEENSINNKNFLGKKREKSPSNSSERPKKSQSNDKKENEKEKKEEPKIKSDLNNSADSSLGKMLEMHIFNYLYDKIMNKSLSNESELEKKIIEFINEKGYSNVKSSLINIKKEKEKEKKENVNPSVQKMKQLDEIHYLFVNNFYQRFKSIKTKDGFQTYVCCDKNCKGSAKLNIKERKFEIVKPHSVTQKEHLQFIDDRPIFFMKSRNLVEAHIKRNEHNDKYHLEWFN